MREKRYPGPASSISQPESVMPSLVNCTASGAGLLGPSVSWKRANSEPTPEKGKKGLAGQEEQCQGEANRMKNRGLLNKKKQKTDGS